MKAKIFYFSKKGEILAEIIAKDFEKAGSKTEKSDDYKAIGDAFVRCSLLVFISAAAIAVRGIAPFVKDKKTDPAVVCLDDNGKFVISLLSGHIGGGNDFAKRIANILLGTAVITTATDVNGKFACDSWAKKNGCEISDMNIAKAVSAEILNRDIPMFSDFELIGKAGGVNVLYSVKDGKVQGETLGIYLTYKTEKPFKKTLSLFPKCIIIGIGCKRGTSKEKLASTLFSVLEANNISPHSIARIASIDVKKDEEGLLNLAKELDVPIDFYSAEKLSQVEGDFSVSTFVESVVGVSNVCERSCMCHESTQLIVPKTASDGVTVAVSVCNKRFIFGGEYEK